MSAESDKTYQVSAYSDPIIVRVNGRANLHNAHLLDDFFRGMMKRGKRRFIIDFGKCAGMDSTFLGILAGTALDIQEKGDNEKDCLILTNLNDRNYDLMRNLGLHLIADVVQNASEAPKATGSGKQETLGEGQVADDSQAKARMILKAHQDLVRIDSANQERFQDVIAFLKNQIEDSR